MKRYSFSDGTSALLADTADLRTYLVQRMLNQLTGSQLDKDGLDGPRTQSVIRDLEASAWRSEVKP